MTSSRQVCRLKRQTIRRGASLAIVATALILALFSGCKGTKSEPPVRFDDPASRKLLRISYYGAAYGKGDSLLSYPLAVEIGRDGVVYVADQTKSRVKAFAQEDGKFLFAFNKTYPGRRLSLPSFLAVNPVDGNVFVSDWYDKALYEFTAKGKFVREIAAPKKIGKSWAPTAITFDKSGNLYVVDVSKEHRVAGFKGADRLRLLFGRYGKAKSVQDKPGSLWFPAGIEVAPNGWIFVSDSLNRRLQVFDEAGKHRDTIPTGGMPRGIALGPNSMIFVTDASGQRLLVFSPTGEMLKSFGHEGYKAGQFDFPNDVAVDVKNGLVFVADRDNRRVQAWRGK
ncbi:MAG: hypothetical protein C4521_01150 [Actinobacteria bacterium]|nr:MAG: hypothetical protein C4521_01150 [Actinomycetota bacterium]